MNILESDSRYLSLTKGFLILSKSIIGLGIVLLGSNMYYLGFGYGFLSILLFAILTSLSLHFLSQMSHEMETFGYISICKAALKGPGKVLSIIFNLVLLLGGLIVYFFYIFKYSDASLSFFVGKFTDNTQAHNIINLMFLVISFKLADINNPTKSPISSLVGITTITAITGLFAYKAITGLTIAGNFFTHYIIPSRNFPSLSLDALKCFNILVLAFTSHFTIGTITQELKLPTKRRRLILIISSITFSSLIYYVLSFASYIIHGNKPIFDVFSTLPRNNLNALAQFLFSIYLIFSSLLLSDTAQELVDLLLLTILGKESFVKSSNLRHFSKYIFFNVLPFITAIFIKVKTANIILYISSFFGSILMFVLPPIMFLILKSKFQTSKIEITLAYILMVMGIIVTSATSSFFVKLVYERFF